MIIDPRVSLRGDAAGKTLDSGRNWPDDEPGAHLIWMQDAQSCTVDRWSDIVIWTIKIKINSMDMCTLCMHY